MIPHSLMAYDFNKIQTMQTKKAAPQDDFHVIVSFIFLYRDFCCTFYCFVSIYLYSLSTRLVWVTGTSYMHFPILPSYRIFLLYEIHFTNSFVFLRWRAYDQAFRLEHYIHTNFQHIHVHIFFETIETSHYSRLKLRNISWKL